MSDPIKTSQVEKWIEQVVERLTSLPTFHDSKFWIWLVEEWEQESLNLLPIEIIPFEIFEKEIFNPLESGLYEAYEEIEWVGSARDSFNSISEDLIYLNAVILFDKTRFPIQTSLANSVKEWVAEDFFKLERGFNQEYITIPLNQITVSPGANVYTGSAIASTLHLISKVPSLPESLDVAETVERVLDPNRHRNEWQRSLISNRVKHIDSFLSGSNNFFVNPIIIHLQKDVGNAKIITRNGNPQLKILLSKFLDEGNHLLGDQRPLDIIDGQHRVRGSARSSKGGVTDLPFVLIPGTYSTDLAAKLFTEINTTSKELDKDHQLYLAYRYRLTHHKSDLTMNLYDAELRNYHDRANRMAYELAGRLSAKNQSLENQIKFLQSNSSKHSVEIVQWQNYVKKWFMVGQPYGPDSGIERVSDIFTEVNNYFTAWTNTLGNAWIPTSKSGWNGRSIFQRKTCFRVLLTRFIQVFKRAKIISPDEHIISTAVFEEVLSPLNYLSSSDSRIISAFNRTSEFYWKCLDAWIYDAIDHGVSYGEVDIISTSIEGKPGRGILSNVLSPDQWVIEDDDRGNWPSSNQARYITVKRPSNCYMSLKIAVLSGTTGLRDVSRNTITWNSDNHCKVPIRANIIPEDLEQIKVRLTWRNAIGEQERTLTISKD